MTKNKDTKSSETPNSSQHAAKHAVTTPAHHKIARKQKSVTIKHHHAKPFRKRHIASLTLFLFTGVLLIGLVINYNQNVNRGIQAAKDFISQTFNPKAAVSSAINSTYGFTVTYDSAKFYATAIDTQTGDLFISNELKVNRAYELVRIAPTPSDTESQNNNMTIHYYHKVTIVDPNNLASVEQTAIKDITAKANLQATKTGTSNVMYGGTQFLKTDWEFQSNNNVLAGFTPTFTTYTTLHNGKAFVVEIIHNPIGTQKTDMYESVLQSLTFGAAEPSAALPAAAGSEQTAQKSRNIIESFFMGEVAAAADDKSYSNSSEKISAAYGPAVVKIFNAYCQDIYFDGVAAATNVCSGSTGSGFFISSDGYIASNGHVTTSDPLDILIQLSYEQYAKGNTKPLDKLITLANIKKSDIPANGTPQERAEALFNMLYKIDPARLEARNSVINLLVCLGKEQPDVKELVKVTTARQRFAQQDTIKKAEVVAQDYRSIQGFSKFITSDVSIIKIEGSNYPVTKLGTIAALQQGANLSILGYPGNASSNGIVDGTLSEVTLTSGKVSAIKNALGSDKKLIETDTTIGHGNSGGPAFNDSGEVMGISTYTAAKVGDGTYNYVRDVKDIIDLAGVSSVTVSNVSKTQEQWQKALDQFNTAHYSKSLKTFATVKNLYPAHPKVDEFAAAAQQNIKDGKDVKDLPVLLAAIVGVLLLIAAAAVTLILYRHKKVHNVYKAQVGAGIMQPIAQGADPQTVSYDPAYVAAQKNVVDMHNYMQQTAQTPQAPQAPQVPMQTAVPPMQPVPQVVTASQPVTMVAPIAAGIEQQSPIIAAPQQPANQIYGTMPAAQTITPTKQNQQPPVPPVG